MWTSTTGGDYHRSYGPGPWVDAYRTADGAIVHRGYSYNPDTSSFTVDVPSMYPPTQMSELDWYRLNGIDIKSEEEIPKMNIYEDRDVASLGRRHAVACSHAPDLEQDKILKCISMMKSKLMMQCAPVKVRNIECKMTPAVKENIVMACKRLEMYGKKTPFIARFDEYGRRLPDEIKIDTMNGMTIKIVDPTDYGPYYLSFEGIAYDDVFTYKPSFDDIYEVDKSRMFDVPF